MKHSEAFLYGDKCPIEDLGDGLKRQLLGFNQQILMAKIWFDESAVGYVHAHHHAQATYIESGKFKVTVGDEEKILSAGDGFYIDPNVKHGAVCLEAGILIDVFSPLREDFFE